ncbi:multicopper oxidase family protein [Aliiroseovarius sp. F20344]|uniref:multicopper oxidase family protein n=1 Tax=Aliiroseovarius sp. F20344 TaxID=2926414 RepID=UPI001FF3E77F|nr:multicopper oxidase family protein [Aliiroseovarius sp. F20344]
MKSNVNRRQFLAGATALSTLPYTATATPATPDLTARLGKVQLAPVEYPETEIWGYDGGVPGPEIRLRQGESLTRRLVNELPQPTSIHWHGLRIPNAMDGVPGMTQDAVAPGENYTYEFSPPDAGTYWYHSHNQSTEQVARGLYGLLIVDEVDPPDVDHDISVVIDDWRLTEHAAISDDFGAMHDWTHAGRMGNFVHSHLTPSLNQVKRNDRLRVRLVNVSTDRVMMIGLHGMVGAIVALDGMPLLAPKAADHAILGPAQRADFILDVTADLGDQALIAIHEGDEAFILSDFSVVGTNARVARGAISALPPNPLTPMAKVVDAREVKLHMEGGAMGGLRQGIWKGEEMSVQELVNNGQIWTFNGVAGLPETPLIELSQGEILRIPMRNDTAFPHAMHLHGHHFQEEMADGSLGPLRDTIMMDRGQEQTIVFRAENPGDWLLHCHMLSHQAAGMKTWLRVTA